MDSIELTSGVVFFVPTGGPIRPPISAEWIGDPAKSRVPRAAASERRGKGVTMYYGTGLWRAGEGGQGERRGEIAD